MSKYKDQNWRKVTLTKFKCILDILKKGYFTFYLDTDIVILGNIFLNIFSLEPKDMWIQKDGDFTKRSSTLCTGCMFFNPTRKSIAFLENLIKINHNFADDQDTLNSYMKKGGQQILYGVLDPNDYPNGAYYFGETPNGRIRLKKNRCVKPLLIHNNFIVGIEKKNERFKKHGLWFL